MVVSVQSSSTADTSSVSLQDFKDGKVNISKNDLINSVKNTIANGKTPSTTMLDIIDSYDKIDTNGDGISYKELETYKNTAAGLISSLGISTESFQQRQLSLFSEAFLNNSSDDETGDLSFLTSNNISPHTSSILNKYLSGNSSTLADKTSPSLIDFLS